MTMNLMTSKTSKNNPSELTIDHAMPMTMAKTAPRYSLPVTKIFCKIYESAYKSPIEIAGEKSSEPICIHLVPRNIFKNGSQSADKILPGAEYCAPGIHVRIMRIKHKNE